MPAGYSLAQFTFVSKSSGPVWAFTDRHIVRGCVQFMEVTPELLVATTLITKVFAVYKLNDELGNHDQ